uniref:Uncharacterized protein n=1 Tax=Heliothis virescens TaxID=7102 RepID=A0A2A4JBR1_HELVI
MSKLRLCTDSKLDGKSCKQPETPCKHCPIKSDLHPSETCKCEVAARALSDDVPKFLGLKNLRATVQKESGADLTPKVSTDPEGTKHPKNPNEAKNPKKPSSPRDPKDPKDKYCKDLKTQPKS